MAENMKSTCDPTPWGTGKTLPKTVKNMLKTSPEPPKPAPKPTLTVKQQFFVKEYLIDLNATGAAIRAGYSRKTARAVGCENLTKPYIRAVIDAEIEARKARISFTSDQVLEELARIGFADMKDFVKIDESGMVQAIPLETMAEGKSRIIKKVKDKRVIRTTKGTESNPDGDQILDATFEFELCDKVKCLELLARHLGLLHDKQQIDIKQPVIIEIVKFAK